MTALRSAAASIVLAACMTLGCAIPGDSLEESHLSGSAGSGAPRDLDNEAATRADFYEADGDEREPLSGAAAITATACSGNNGDWSYCSTSCPCESGEGDCDSDAQCAAGYVCMRDTGGLFDWDPEVDVCLEECADIAIGTPDFCSPSCPCESGQGDCDEDSDCASGNVCAKNVGAAFGYPADVDVCVNACDDIRNGAWDFCSPACPCEDGQGDCDSNSDCAPGHVCALNVGAEYGYDATMDVCQSVLELFAGHVIEANGKPVAGAVVSIDGHQAITGDDGAFALSVIPSERYVINVEKDYYVPESRIHVGKGMEDMAIPLTKAELILIDPTQDVVVEAARGTRIELPANALVDENGEAAKDDVVVAVHTYDLQQEGMVGDMQALDIFGNEVMLESVGAVSVEFTDEEGNRYNLAPGQTAQIALALPPGSTYSGDIPLWHYDMEKGKWIEEGMGFVQDGIAMGEVSHFSAWNFDIKQTNSSCIRVEVPQSLIDSSSLQARVKVNSTTFPREKVVDFDDSNLQGGMYMQVLYNLPPDTNVDIFVPPDAAQPLDSNPEVPGPQPFNSGNATAGIGVPQNISVCAPATLPSAIPSSIKGIARAHRPSGNHAGIEVKLIQGGATVRSDTTDANGEFVLANVPSGNGYTLVYEYPGYLEAFTLNSFTITGGKNDFRSCVQLIGGDVNNDDAINFTDTSLINELFAGGPQDASNGELTEYDLNGDGQVDDKDFDVASLNIGKNGPKPVTASDSQCNVASNVTNVFAGGAHTCALLTGGQIKCWGRNSVGQLGTGNTADRGDDETLLTVNNVKLSETSTIPVSTLALGGFHTCAITQENGSNQVRCWGGNSSGQLGLNSTAALGDNEPISFGAVVNIGFPAGDPVQTIAAGNLHTCARSAGNRLICWGNNAHGQLGLGKTEHIGDDEAPADEASNAMTGIKLVATGLFHTCAVTTSNAVKCWGNNQFGQLGRGDTITYGDGSGETHITAPNVPIGSGNIESIVAGDYHTCVLVSGSPKQVRCWGLNNAGQLGYGDTNNRGDNGSDVLGQPVFVGFDVAEITAGGFHTCARSTIGAVRCWGQASVGQLGYGNLSNIGDGEAPNFAGNVNFGDTATRITAGREHTCVTTNTGMRCWGRGVFGRLGYGNILNFGDDEAPLEAGLIPFL